MNIRHLHHQSPPYYVWQCRKAGTLEQTAQPKEISTGWQVSFPSDWLIWVSCRKLNWSLFLLGSSAVLCFFPAAFSEHHLSKSMCLRGHFATCLVRESLQLRLSLSLLCLVESAFQHSLLCIEREAPNESQFQGLPEAILFTSWLNELP